MPLIHAQHVCFVFTCYGADETLPFHQEKITLIQFRINSRRQSVRTWLVHSCISQPSSSADHSTSHAETLSTTYSWPICSRNVCHMSHIHWMCRTLQHKNTSLSSHPVNSQNNHHLSIITLLPVLFNRQKQKLNIQQWLSLYRVRTDIKTLFSRTFQDLQRPNSRVFQDSKNAFQGLSRIHSVHRHGCMTFRCNCITVNKPIWQKWQNVHNVLQWISSLGSDTWTRK